MEPPAPALPAPLLRGLHRVDDALAVERYNAALVELGAEPTGLARFHLDAAGYSPEVAEERGDALYLCGGVLRAHAVILAVEQLTAPLVHPGLGFAADAYRRVSAAARREIGRITLREPLVAEAGDPATRLTAVRHLADPAHVEIHFRTPGGLVRNLKRLEAMKHEFLRSERRWLDDAFIGEMAELAGEVRDLGAIEHDFAASSHALGPFYAAAFGGSYVLEEPGASARTATTWVLCAEPPAEADEDKRSARGRRVVIERLDAASATALLERHGLARIDPEALREHPERLERLAHWIALDRLLDLDPGSAAAGLDTARVRERMLAAGEPPSEYVELEELRRRLRSRRGGLDPDALSPLLRLRLLEPAARREPIRRFARHLRAGVDPVQLGRAWSDARDLLYARLPGLSTGRRAALAAWLEG